LLPFRTGPITKAMSVLCNHEAAARWKGSLPVDAVVAGMDSQCVPSAIEDIGLTPGRTKVSLRQ
jgi:hypothetical protein